MKISLSLSLVLLTPLAFGQSLDDVLPTGAKVERIATGFNKWTEGPVWTRSGFLLFAEIPGNSILKWAPGQSATVFLHPSGYKGDQPYGGPEPGSNGMTLDSKGRLTVAGHAQRDVWRLESLDPKSTPTILADSYQGKRLSSPNDLVYKSDGSLYFTDPPYGLPTQGDQDPLKEIQFNGVYRLVGARDQKPGAPPAHEKLELIISDLPRPNGIAFSPDEKTLYIANSGPKFWMRYDVQPDGSVKNGVKFGDANASNAVGAPDGMKVDIKGNLYSTGPGGIWVFSPAGEHLGTIPVPENAANMAWGDQDFKTMYITGSTSLYRIRLKIAGIPAGGK